MTARSGRWSLLDVDSDPVPGDPDAVRTQASYYADMARTIRHQVESGAYSSNSEVIREALRLWQDRRADREQRLAVIRAQLQEAADDPRRATAEELARHFDERLAGAGNDAKP